jgi:hypothetical protein
VQFVITSTPPLPVTVVEVVVVVVKMMMMWKIFHVNTPPFVFAISVTVHSDAFALESYI